MWIAYDTPVDEDDRADVDYVVERARELVQLPRRGGHPDLVAAARRHDSASRGAGSHGRVLHPRTCVSAPRSPRSRSRSGSSSGSARTANASRIEELLGAFSERIEWMGVESAELVKHGVNAFLALSITFANELAGIAERVGADAAEVERGLKTESRIGPRAYLRPGGAFAGGTLARDVEYLTQIGDREGVPTQLLGAVRASNEEHKRGPGGRSPRWWETRTAGWRATSSRSGALSTSRERTLCGVRAPVELCRELPRAGAVVKAHDSAVRVVPDDLSGVFTLCTSPLEAAAEASAVVVQTDWPPYREIDAGRLVATMRSAIVVDPNGSCSRRWARPTACGTSGSAGARRDGCPRRESRDRHRRQPRARARDRAHVSRSGSPGTCLRARRDRARARARPSSNRRRPTGARSRPPRPTSRSRRRSTVSSPMRSTASRRSTCW